MKGSARLVTGSLRASAHAVGGMAVSARPTDAVSMMKYLRVKPVEPQTLVWLVPQYGVDYTIESNTNWNIK